MVLTVKIEQFLFIHVLVETVSETQKQLFSKLIVVVSSKINYKNKQNGQIIRVQKSVAVSLICFICRILAVVYLVILPVASPLS